MNTSNLVITKGGILMVFGMLIFLTYAVIFLFVSLSGVGFEIGVYTLSGVTPAELDTINPAIMAYMNHLHVAVSGFIASTSFAVIALVWCGVQRGYWWAWWAAMISPSVAFILISSLDYAGDFKHNWVAHAGPIYLGMLVFLIGGLITLNSLTQSKIKPRIKVRHIPSREREMLKLTFDPKIPYS
ncbi:hypothetical protein OAN307_c30490 [Octadecabacter antarcticus 307]|uniref:DUF998 domain-containing protein n=1 Tax=Octadecabacter antarcticus 307 TaxID=391626 RepID=M9R8P6_9RHOB|nr:hypothetical protein [Octadecabacter antarcticus]AGI68592.1 hypothetical protein OAN307_c30490 [Octadecabacter antarcticus 307]